MTDQPSNNELTGELLSAYVDGELTANERAEVEARLAIDPAAQKLLHELRAVSQAVQANPTTSLNRDLSEEILRRTRKTTLAVKSAIAQPPGASEPVDLKDMLPSVRPFASKRSWIWASLVLAAGLLMMFLQPRNDTKTLPPIATRDHHNSSAKPTDEVALSPSNNGPLSPPAAPPASSPPAGAVVADGSGNYKPQRKDGSSQSDATANDGFVGSGQKIAQDKSHEPVAPPAAIALSKPTQEPAPEASADSHPSAINLDKTAPALEPETGALKPKAEPSYVGSTSDSLSDKFLEAALRNHSAERFTIVRLVVSSAALQSNSLERLLANNKITFVAPPAEKKLTALGGELATKPIGTGESTATSAPHANTIAAGTDLVLVEAPFTAIESLLTDINKNTADFTSIAIAEEPRDLLVDHSDKKEVAFEEQADRRTNLARFNRGKIPSGSPELSRLKSYWKTDTANKLAANGAAQHTGSTSNDIAVNAPPASSLQLRRARALEVEDANRLAGEATATKRAAGAPASGTALQPQPGFSGVKASEAKQRSSTYQKVLFVIIPEMPAPSGPPTGDRPK